MDTLPSLACHSRCARHTGIDLVDVYVSKEEAHCRLHKKLLCARSPFFRAAFTGLLKEAQSSTIKLPEDSVETFNVVVAWMYSDVVPAGVSRAVLCDACRLGEKYLIPELQNAIITVFANHMKENPEDMPDSSFLKQVCRDLNKGHPLLRFWADWAAYGLWEGDSPATTYDEVFAESPAFAAAMVHKLADLKRRIRPYRHVEPPWRTFVQDTENYFVRVAQEGESSAEQD